MTRERPLVAQFDVEPNLIYDLSADLFSFDRPDLASAVASFTFFGTDTRPLEDPQKGFSHSVHLTNYKYIPCAEEGGSRPPPIPVKMPSAARSLEIKVMAWRTKRLMARGPIALKKRSTAIKQMTGLLRAAEASEPAPLQPEPVKATPQAPKSKSAGLAASPGQSNQPGREVIADEHWSCKGGGTYLITATLELGGKPHEKMALLTASFRDAVFSEIADRYPGFSSSEQVGQYQYLSPRAGEAATMNVRVLLRTPSNAASGRLALRQWSRTPIALQGKLSIQEAKWEEYIASVDLKSESVQSLRALREFAVDAGDLDTTVRITAALYAANPDNASGRRLRIVAGQNRELDTRWAPHVFRAPKSKPVDPQAILHLFKVIYPQESSGGAVRNWNIVTAQAKAGMRPVACLSVQAEPIRDERVDQGDKDGSYAVEREGCVFLYSRYSAFDRKNIPPDTIVEFETNLHAEVLAAHRCSLVHAASGFRGYDNALKGLALARRFGLPFVYEVRSFHEHTWGPISAGVLDAPLTRKRIAQENRCMAAADAVVTISQAMVAELTRRGVPAEKLFLVPNSVDDHFLLDPDPEKVEELRSRLGLQGKTVIGYISNISQREGHEILLRGFARVAVERKNLVCLIIGNGPERGRLEQLAQALGIADRTIFTGDIDHLIIREAYALIDIFVVPRLEDYASDYVTPMKPFEALAIGCRLIMSDRPVSGEVVGAEERGVLFRTGDAMDLADKIENVLRYPGAARMRAKTGKSWVRQERTWRHNAEIYSSIYAFARNQFTRWKENEGTHV